MLVEADDRRGVGAVPVGLGGRFAVELVLEHARQTLVEETECVERAGAIGEAG